MKEDYPDQGGKGHGPYRRETRLPACQRIRAGRDSRTYPFLHAVCTRLLPSLKDTYESAAIQEETKL